MLLSLIPKQLNTFHNSLDFAFTICGTTPVNCDASHNVCFWTKLLDVFYAMSKAASLVRAEWDNLLSRKIVIFKERPKRHGKCPPPNGVAHDNVVVRRNINVPYVCGACVRFELRFSLFGAFGVIQRILFLRLHLEHIHGICTLGLSKGCGNFFCHHKAVPFFEVYDVSRDIVCSRA